MNADRQTALRLHALPTADRRWILSRLPAGPRRELDGLLQELRALGIPPQFNLDGLGDMNEPAAAVLTPSAALHAASAQQVHALIGDEPVWLQARVLGLATWPWQADFIAGLAPQRRAALARCAPVRLGTDLEQALLTQLAQRLAMPAATGPAHRPARRLGGALAKALQRCREVLSTWQR